MATPNSEIVTTDSNSQPGGKTPFLDASTARQAYEDDNKWMRPYFDPIEEFERIARNKPSDRIPKGLPRVTDGTTAAIIQEDPKRIIQTLATGLVECMDYPEYAKIADLVHVNKLLPMYNRMGTALQKQWNMLSKAKTWGRSTSYTFFTSSNGQFHTDFNIPYIKDIITEKGKVYAPDSNREHMRSWYQQTDLKRILKWEIWMEKNREGYKSDWDLKALSDFIDNGGAAKPAELQTPAEKEKGGDSGGWEVIHTFQEGIGAEFYSFAPGDKDGATLRKKINKDPRGRIPLDHEYNNIDLSNPLGVSSIQMSGGVQNLIDQQMQMFQFITTLLMGPPLQVWGTNVNKATLKFKPNAIWEMGTNAQNRVEPYQISNHAIQQFSQNYGLLKSQIMNLNSSQDHSVSSQDAPGQSKTQAGVQAQESRLGTSDNYSRQQHETWFNDQAETSINIYFAEMTTEDTLKLDNDDMKEIMKTDAAKYVDQKTKTLKIPYDKIKDVSFKFTVDGESSEIKEDEDNAAKLSDALKLVQVSQDPTVRKAEVKITKMLLSEIGAKGTEDLFPDEETDEAGNPVGGDQAAADPNAMMQQLMPQVQQMIQEAMAQKAEKEKEDPTLALMKALKLDYKDLPDEARKIVLEHTGLGGDEVGTNNDPIEHTQNLTTLDAMNQADAHDRQPEQAQADRDFQSQQSDKQMQAEQQRSEQAAAAGDQTTSPSSSSSAANDQSTTPAADTMSPSMSTEDPSMGELNPDEQEFVEALIQRKFSDDDIEQALVMKRQEMPLDQIISTLGAKYATQQ